MFRSFKAQKKVVAIWSLFSIVLNIFQPAFVAITLAPIIAPSNVNAQEVLPSDSPAPTVTPSESPNIIVDPSVAPSAEPTATPIISPDPTIAPSVDPTPSPTPDASLAPSATPDGSVLPSVSPTASPNTNHPTNPTPSSDSSPAPPSTNANSTPAITPSITPTPAPTSTPELNEQLNISIVDNTAAKSIQVFDLTVNESGSATLTTDKLDYAPTDTAIITGAGFLKNTIYKLVISSTDTPATSTTVDVKTDDQGILFYAYQLDGNYRPNYKVEAYLANTLVATIAFTDASGASANLDQYDNFGAGIGWQNGNLNQNDAKYHEGDSVPYRFVMSGVGSGSHTITFEWDTTKSGKHALDYITTFDRTVSSANPCFGVVGCGSPTTFAIPSQPGTVNQIAGNITLYNGTISGVSAYSFSGADNSARITVTFTATSTTPVLSIGGHIGTQSDWGIDNAAGAVSGSPYHMRLISIDGGGGNQDRSLAAGAIYPIPGLTTLVSLSSIVINNQITDTATYTVVGQNGNVTGSTKFFVCGPNVSATACTTGGTQVGSSIVNSNNLAVSTTFTPTQIGNYCFRAEYTPDASAQYSPINHTNATTECFNVTNPPTGTLRVIKTVINDNGGSKVPSDFTFQVNSATATSFEVDGQNDLTVSPGLYTITEPTASGYTTSYDNCSSVLVASGNTTICTITNNDVPPQLHLRKTVTNNNGGNANITDWTLSATGTVVSPTNLSGVTPVDSGATFKADTYTLGESGPAGYTGTWNCNVTMLDATHVVVPFGGDVTCTINNDDNAAHLIVKKHVINDNGGTAGASSFTTTISGVSTTTPSSPGSEAGIDNVLTTVGTYSVDEGAHVGYAKTLSADCTGTMALGETKTCTITNDDISPTLTVIKHVVNDNNGNKVAGDFTMDLSGSNLSDDSFPGAENPGTTVSLNAGSYGVDEVELSGYAKTLGNNCSGTIAIGESKTCTITNNDISPTLTLVKTVITDNGGNLQVSQVPLFINGVPAVSGTAYNVPANTLLTASETNPSGYLASVWGTDCADNGTITLLPGQNKTCTITNNDIAPILTFIKDVDNNYGGTLGVSDFPLYINGNPVVSGTPNTLFANLLYTLTELQQYGYTSLGFSGDCATNGTITLALGDVKTCTITNTDIQPKLTVTKVVVNDNGGTKVVTDFPLFVGATGVISGTQNGFNAGTYTISETNQSGYSSTISGDCAKDGSVTLAVGDVKSCTITNDDQPGTLIVNKDVINDNGGSALPNAFGYQIGTGAIVPFELDGSNSQTVNSGTYTITEPAFSGYTTSYNNCTSVFVPNGGSATCTITNDDQQASIKVVKVVTNDDGGSATPDAFNLTLEGNAVLSGVSTPVNPGTYTAGETLLSGYTFEGFSGSCDNNGDITVALGESKTCTLTNNDQQSYVVINKTVVNNNGGSAVANDFNLTVDGNAVLDEVAYPVNPGVHTAGETQLPGYTASAWGGDCNGQGSVTVALGQTKTCTITNDDQQAYITLTKVVTNDNGGTAQPNDFKLTLEGDAVLSGITKAVNPGIYTADETLLPGYTFSGYTGDCNTSTGDITVALGESKSCTLTNDDNAPSLTLVKEVVNNNGGTAKYSDWTLTATGYDKTSPQTGTYDLSESNGPDGYTQTSLTCDNSKGQVTSVTLGLGESVICTFVNDDIAPTLKLVKKVVAENGGNETPASWTLTATGDTGFSDTGDSTTFHTVKAGIGYVLSESTISGYVPSAWSCDGGSLVRGTVTLGLDEDVTCEITNDDVAPTLTVIKNVLNDNGGNAVVSDFDIELNKSNLTFGQGDTDGDITTYISTPTVLSNTQYDLSEIDFAGYKEGTWSCTDTNTKLTVSLPLTLSEGQNVTCLITNDDIAPTITLNKIVVGGSAAVNDFGLTIGKTSVTSGQTLTVNSNTPYALNELGLDGYSFTSITGNAKCPEVLDGTVTLNEDEDITCTITNTRDTGTLIIHKLIDRDGSNNTTDDRFVGASWTVDVNGSGNDISNPDSQLTNSLGYSTFNSLKTGDYSVSEIQQDGYELINAYCDQEEGNLDGNIVYGVSLGKNQTMNCTFVNAPNSTLHGYKWHDLNNNGIEDEIGSKLAGWTITLSKDNGEGYDFVQSMVTDSSDLHYGWYWFEHLFPGTYKICETNQSNWLQTFPIANNGCHIVTLPAGSSGDTLGEEVQNATFGVPYNFGNVKYSTVTVTKYNDKNGNGYWDEGEEVLSDWGMNLTEEESSLQDTTNEDGNATFGNILPGNYILSEDLQDGWMQTNIACSSDRINESRLLRQLDNDNSHDITVRAGSEISCRVGNQAKPELRIQKSNDATGNKNPGDIVTYTLVVDLLEGSNLNNVFVTDVTPDGFDYVAGSWTAVSNIRGDIKNAPTTEPNYASPGTWNLGDMTVGEIITLTYQAKISANQDGGTYNDIAWAEGNSEVWGTLLALGHDSEYVDADKTFVGTDVTVNKTVQETGSVDIEREGEVLGASTELPSTGANTNWLLLAIGALISGLFLIFGGKRMQKLSLGAMIFVASFVFTQNSRALAVEADPMTIRIEQPSSPTRINEWKLSFSVLDRSYGTPVVNCFVKKPGAGSFVGFGATHTSVKTMGDNGNCQVNSSVMSEQGDYQFYVTAVSGSYSENSETVTVKYDTNGPGTPTSYSKEHSSSCQWIIKFHTADDGGATTKVEIYSSDSKNFDTNNGSRVGTVSIGSNQDGTFTHDRADNCDREWYYVIRAFDAAGNQSGHRGDELVTISSTTVSSSPTAAALVTTSANGNVLGKKDSKVEEVNEGEVLGEESTPAAEKVDGNGLMDSAKEAVKNTAKNRTFWWIFIALIALRIIYGIARKEK